MKRPLTSSLLLALLACSAERTASSTPATLPVESQVAISEPALPPTAAADFVLRIDDFNWEVQGSELIFVHADRSAEHIDYKLVKSGGVYEPRWRQRRFHVSAAALEGLQQLLASEPLVELEPLYVNPEIHDGANGSYTWKTNGVTKTVQCSNNFPPAVRELDRYVKANIIDAIPRTVRYEPLRREQMEALSKAKL